MIPQFLLNTISEHQIKLKEFGLSITFEFEIFISGYPLKWPENSRSFKGFWTGTVPLSWEGEKIGTYYWQGVLDAQQLILHRLLLENLVVNMKLQLSQNQFDCGIGVLNSAIKAIEAKDHYTGGHSDRVAAVAMEIAAKVELDSSTFDVEFAAKLHDIGKIGISENVLLKPGRLEKSEFDEIMKHPEIGAKILGPLSLFAHLVPIIRHHHEKYDGTGYPDRLAGNDIPRLSRIISVADTFDALTSNRPYRRAMELERAREIIMHERGTQFDPIVVDAFTDLPHYLLMDLRAS